MQTNGVFRAFYRWKHLYRPSAKFRGQQQPQPQRPLSASAHHHPSQQSPQTVTDYTAPTSSGTSSSSSSSSVAAPSSPSRQETLLTTTLSPVVAAQSAHGAAAASREEQSSAESVAESLFRSSQQKKYIMLFNSRDSVEQQIATDSFPLIYDNENALWLLFCAFSSCETISRERTVKGYTRFRRPLLSQSDVLALLKDIEVMPAVISRTHVLSQLANIEARVTTDSNSPHRLLPPSSSSSKLIFSRDNSTLSSSSSRGADRLSVTFVDFIRVSV